MAPVQEFHDRPGGDGPDDGRDGYGGRDRSPEPGRFPEPGDGVVRDAAARTAQALEYRQRVEAAYRQDATDHGHGQRGTPAREADPGRAPPGATSRDLPTGARGPASGREFDPEAAGGPVRQLDAGTAAIASEGVAAVAAHLRRFTGGGALEGPERAMLGRLASIAAGDMKPTWHDLNFYTHELDEASRYAKLGLGPGSGADLGAPEMYDVWNNVHTAALEDYRISGADLFYPGTGP
jgi:hypothetical protein